MAKRAKPEEIIAKTERSRGSTEPRRERWCAGWFFRQGKANLR